MSEFKFNCPGCGARLEAEDDMKGQIVECPHCSKTIRIPMNVQPPSPAEQPPSPAEQPPSPAEQPPSSAEQPPSPKMRMPSRPMKTTSSTLRTTSGTTQRQIRAPMPQTNLTNTDHYQQSSQVSLLGRLWRKPGYDSNDWLFPKFCRFFYLLAYIMISIATIIAFGTVIYANLKSARSLSPQDIFFTLVTLIAIPLVGLLCLCIVRILYEKTILRFRLFECVRDSLEELKKSNS